MASDIERQVEIPVGSLVSAEEYRGFCANLIRVCLSTLGIFRILSRISTADTSCSLFFT